MDLETSMKLNHWRNPHNANLERLYVSGPALIGLPEIDSKDVKIWIEPSENVMAGWVIKSKGDVSGLGKGVMLQKRVIEFLGIDPSASWSDLVVIANASVETGKRRKARKLASFANGPRPSATRAAEAEALDVSSIKMPGPVIIQVDHREPASLINLLAEHPDITVEIVSLDLGDILIEDREGNRLIIERKRCDDASPKTDFEASIQTSGRLFDQSERLKMEVGASDKQVIPIFLLEGDVYGNATSMLCQQIDGAVSFLSAIQKVSVLPTLNANHTAYMVAKLATHFLDGLYTPVSLHKAKPKAIFEQQVYVLEALPGVSTKAAQLLLETFGSVRKVMAASKSELLAINGLGPKKVEALLKVLGEV
jgi:ERCC4-type nuclease